MQKLNVLLADANYSLKIDDSRIELLNDYAPIVYGFNAPEPLVRQAYIINPDLSPVFGWETGRRSEPFSMDQNMHGVRGETGKEPEIVLYQWDDMDVMNPRGLLIAYAEDYVKPVVSDFDTFLVASRGMTYDPIPDEQGKLMLWSLDHCEDILATPDHQSWTSRWIDVLRIEYERGFHPNVPKYGYGDPTTYDMIHGVVQATKGCGAVRHGPECFNLGFPQELDDQFLVVWQDFPERPWAYYTEPELRAFLLDRVKDGYTFPINPLWPVRDPGWMAVLIAIKKSAEGKKVMGSWFCPSLKILDKMDALHAKYPNCFVQKVSMDKPEEDAKHKKDVIVEIAGAVDDEGRPPDIATGGSSIGRGVSAFLSFLPRFSNTSTSQREA